MQKSSYHADINFYIEVGAEFDPNIDFDTVTGLLNRIQHQIRPQCRVEKVIDFTCRHLLGCIVKWLRPTR